MAVVGEIQISHADLLALIELAEDCVITRNSEYSNPPTAEDRALMERMWVLAGKDTPDYFVRHFTWGKP